MTGFLSGCRSFIRVDGCFLKGPFEDVLLVALWLNGNNGYFRIAYAIEQQENKSNWLYFFRALRRCFDNVDVSKFTFISDRHKVSYYPSTILLELCCVKFNAYLMVIQSKYRA